MYNYAADHDASLFRRGFSVLLKCSHNEANTISAVCMVLLSSLNQTGKVIPSMIN